MGGAQISVIMPMHDTVRYVEAAARSVLEQEGVDLELIVVDDASSDGSRRKVEKIGDPRLRVIDGGGRGIAAAFNAGLAEAGAPFLARCDSDDLYAPGRLARQAAWLAEHPEYVAVCGGFATMTARGRVVTDLRAGAVAEDITEELRRGGVRTSLCTWLMRTGAVRRAGGFRDFFRSAEDVDFQLRLVELGPVWFDPVRCYLYRLHDRSVTHSSARTLREFYHDTALAFAAQRRERGADDLQRGRPPQPPCEAAPPARSSEQVQGGLLGAAWDHLQAGRRLRAVRTGVRACLARPRNWRAWRSLGALAWRGMER